MNVSVIRWEAKKACGYRFRVDQKATKPQRHRKKRKREKDKPKRLALDSPAEDWVLDHGARGKCL